MFAHILTKQKHKLEGFHGQHNERKSRLMAPDVKEDILPIMRPPRQLGDAGYAAPVGELGKYWPA